MATKKVLKFAELIQKNSEFRELIASRNTKSKEPLESGLAATAKLAAEHGIKLTLQEIEQAVALIRTVAQDQKAPLYGIYPRVREDPGRCD